MVPAIGYQYYEVVSFPTLDVGKVIHSQHQDALLPEWVDEQPSSEITMLGLADNTTFSKYKVAHETYEAVQGRYKNEKITGYIAQVEFHIFRHQTLPYMLIDANRRICSELVRRFERSTEEFKVIPHIINLTRLAGDLLAAVRGGWFGNLQVANVSTIGLFGPTVGESDEWDRYGQLGNLRALDVELKVDDWTVLVKVMANRGVVLFGNFTEDLSLTLLTGIQSLLDGYATQTQ